MTRGLSQKQLILIGVYLLVLAATFIAVMLEQWRIAAGLGVVAFGLFSALLIFTLAAMTYAAGRARRRIHEMHQELSSAKLLRTMRQLEDRQARLTKQIVAAERRRDAGEQRMLASFEAHRFHIEDDLEELRERLNQLHSEGGATLRDR
ncbi:hypothetical protein [Nesterenkonia sp.]|uniref:hypothetical protein n=1 Tax=Nesterenkonia sp. TaxID=704201 RepID=UPI002620E0CB|nr:hypothetical protein [Nesterenkonia sp.]